VVYRWATYWMIEGSSPCIQTGSAAHPASYPTGTRCYFPGTKAAGAWSWPLTSI